MAKWDLVSLDSSWDALLKRLPNWNVFQTSTWMNTYASVYFRKGHAQGLVVESDGEIIGMLPLVLLKRFGCRITGSPLRHWLTPFSGFAWNDSLTDCMDAYREFLRKSRINYSTVTFSGAEAESCVLPLGFRSVAFKTAITPLREDLDSLWKRIKGGQRNRIRKGEKAGFTIGIFPPAEIIERYVQVRKELYQRQGLNSSKADEFLKEVCTTLPPDSLRVFAAMDGSSLAAAAVLLLYRNTCFGWDTVSDTRYRTSSPGCTVHWKTVVWGHENGYEILDWGGTNTPSIAEYKLSFGAEQQDYLMIEGFSPKRLSLAMDMLRKHRNNRNPKLRTGTVQTLPPESLRPVASTIS